MEARQLYLIGVVTYHQVRENIRYSVKLVLLVVFEKWSFAETPLAFL